MSKQDSEYEEEFLNEQFLKNSENVYNNIYIREKDTGTNQEYKEWASLVQVEIYRHLDRLRIEYMRNEGK